MKKCFHCGIEKELGCFGKKKPTKYNQGVKGYCKICEQKQVEKSRKKIKDNNPLKYAERQKLTIKRNSKLNLRNLAFVYRYLKIFGKCVDCENKDIRVLEFDHIKGTKIEGVIRLASQLSSIHRIKEEIRKCEIRCCNCHRIKTQKQLGWRSNWKLNWL
jgi:hypothetical protein